MADADNIDAWEAPITVPPTSSPRPDWYGQKEIAIGMTVAGRGNKVDVQEFYDFITNEARGATTYAFNPIGITGAAVDFYIVVGAVASVASIANVLWTAYDRFIAPKKPTRDSVSVHIMIPRGAGTINLTLGENVSTEQEFVDQLEGIVADAQIPEVRRGHAIKIRELEQSDSWLKLNGRDKRSS